MLAYNYIYGSEEKLAEYVNAIVKLSCLSKYVNSYPGF